MALPVDGGKGSAFAESTLKPALASLDFTPLVLFMESLAEEIKFHARQGATDDEWRDAQAMNVFEEAGEFAKEYRRWRGFARKPGDIRNLRMELADVIISGFLMFANMDTDAQCYIKGKLYEVITRGYVNKEE